MLLGHGTKDAEGVAEFLQLVAAVADRTGEPVFPGVLEYPGHDLPDVQSAFDLAIDVRLDEVTVLPALLFFAGHTREDVPAELEAARARHPGLQVRVAGPLGADERLLEVVEARLEPFEQTAASAVLLVGRGSLVSEANADLYKTARMLWDRNQFGAVEAAFVSVAPPGVAEGVERCRQLGAREVIVAPYFVNTGVLVKRIAEQALAAGGQPAQHLGVHPLLVDVLVQRLAEARAGLCPCQAGHGCRIPELRCPRGASCLAAA
ncbi:MAG: sirohydrochlorin chelatase [Chloroflexi bacterium]|nr:sirohydrochlorin chelatase [Chloroflexota bacterium]